MNIKTIMTAATLLCAVVGCKENDIAFYNEAPRLEYVTVASCTFNDVDYLNAYIADVKTTEKECKVTAQLIGRLLTEPMTFCMKGEQAENSDFEVTARFSNPYTFPTSVPTCEASVMVTCPTKEFASPYQGTSKTGVLEVTSDTSNPAHQFGLGREENLICSLNVTLQVHPDNWDSEFWYSYSSAKYIFMMETFKTTLDNIEKTQANQRTLRAAYSVYLDEHEPLLDDEGNPLTIEDFPLN